jgi:hypothetical protein
LPDQSSKYVLIGNGSIGKLVNLLLRGQR